MDMIDARTKETAATLLGVAFKQHEPSDSTPPPRNPIDGGGKTAATTSQHQNVTSSPPHRPQHSMADVPSFTQRHSSIGIRPGDGAPPSSSSAHQTNAAPDPTTFLSMSSIGFGIDSSSSATWGDATESAIRALQDAMERSTLRLPMTLPAQHLLQIRVQLGVPPKHTGSNEPMGVDVSRLTSVLPRAIPVLPVRVVVGGLYLTGEAQGSPSICTAVACITLQSHAPVSIPEPQPPAMLGGASQAPPAQFSPWSSLDHHLPPTGSERRPQEPTKTKVGTPASPGSMARKGPPQSPTHGQLSQPDQEVHGGNSIEMLAMISEEIRMAADKKTKPTSVAHSFSAITGQFAKPAHPSRPHASEEPHSCGNASNDSDGQMNDEALHNGNYNYKKLPPGVTTKNNRRLFVKHSYRDHSSERPLPEEQDLLGTTGAPSSRTPNAAFPLKLHETLSQIENNGHGDIIGWIPHGRSFKIHKQKEFAEIILPRYFVMTKKSSFLRQLNLYGFNRFSAGPDQGSYYHEKFLRGLKFLCRRMTRQKVNGNRIRSAGNPDDEPVLARYPACPPPAVAPENPPVSALPPNHRSVEIFAKDGYARDLDDSSQNDESDDGRGESEDERSVPSSEAQHATDNTPVSFPIEPQ